MSETINNELPRCKHDNCLIDGAGEHLEPPCSCRVTTIDCLGDMESATCTCTGYWSLWRNR